jgi:hypothetical protein
MGGRYGKFPDYPDEADGGSNFIFEPLPPIDIPKPTDEEIAMAMDPKKAAQPSNRSRIENAKCTQLAGTSPVLPVCVYVNERDGTVYRSQAAAKDAKKDDKKGKDGKGKKGGGDEKVEEKPTLKPRDVSAVGLWPQRTSASRRLQQFALHVIRRNVHILHVATVHFGAVCSSSTA